MISFPAEEPVHKSEQIANSCELLQGRRQRARLGARGASAPCGTLAPRTSGKCRQSTRVGSLRPPQQPPCRLRAPLWLRSRVLQDQGTILCAPCRLTARLARALQAAPKLRSMTFQSLQAGLGPSSCLLLSCARSTHPLGLACCTCTRPRSIRWSVLTGTEIQGQRKSPRISP